MSGVSRLPPNPPILGGPDSRYEEFMEELCVTDKKKYKFTKLTGSGHQALFQQEKLPHTLAGGGGKRNIHGCSPPSHTPASQGRAPGPAWCSWLRRFLHSPLSAFLCFWIQPLEDGSVPGHAGNDKILLWKAIARRSHQCLSPQKSPPRVTPVQIARWKFPALSSAPHPKQRQALWRLEIGILRGISPHVLPDPLGTQVGVF